jgi:transcription elongation factor Elf1
MTVDLADLCPACERFALIVEQVSEDLQRWVLVCADCGIEIETGELCR